MLIYFSPQRRDDTLAASRQGDTLTINGDVFDFSTLPDGATIAVENSPSPWITSPIERINGELHLTMLLPHGPNPSPAVAFPDPLVDPADGPLVLPHDPKEDEDDLDA
ncbi:MAG TPA: hypothetical protein VNS12_14840 [Pelagibacterium sp.]|uniref:hypothetical protein n=1 Tax=Pelagibacterium sp. TaxID=1967288 RepID=UPI002C0CB4CF|nr:hypothetical protein [Pelagibacterium sp.]HWJ89341.1 hypothetical protein [Pelagibacterium sp.]